MKVFMSETSISTNEAVYSNEGIEEQDATAWCSITIFLSHC